MWNFECRSSWRDASSHRERDRDFPSVQTACQRLCCRRLAHSIIPWKPANLHHHGNGKTCQSNLQIPLLLKSHGHNTPKIFCKTVGSSIRHELSNATFLRLRQRSSAPVRGFGIEFTVVVVAGNRVEGSKTKLQHQIFVAFLRLVFQRAGYTSIRVRSFDPGLGIIDGSLVSGLLTGTLQWLRRRRLTPPIVQSAFHFVMGNPSPLRFPRIAFL